MYLQYSTLVLLSRKITGYFEDFLVVMAAFTMGMAVL
jgi:hypothetical protein